jgi:Bacterial mobilisation protein (MobC)
MARYEQFYTGEHRTRSIGIKLTPSERAQLETAAAEQGAALSSYIRELCLRRTAPEVAATRRNPVAKELLFELNAIGNNLNQLARRANIHGEWPEHDEVEAVLAILKQAIAKVLEL